MPIALKTISSAIRDWLYQKYGLNSTLESSEKLTCLISISNGSQVVLNDISNGLYLLNLLRDKSVLASVQIDTKQLSSDNDLDEKAFEKFLHDNLSEQLVFLKEKQESKSLQENIQEKPLKRNPPPESLENELKTKFDYLKSTGSTSSAARNPDAPPGFEDEYQLLPEHRAPETGPSMGLRDLDPVGRYPAMTPYFDPLAAGSSGGMYPTANDPMFHPNRGQPGGLQRPPGARWDNPVFGSDDPEDIERMGQGLPGNNFGKGLNLKGRSGFSLSGFGLGGFGLSGFGPGAGGFI